MRTGANIRVDKDLPGAKDLLGLGKMTRIYEDLMSNYIQEEELEGEKEISNTSVSVRYLLESLNKMESDADET